MAARPVGSRPAQRSRVGDLRGPRVGLRRGTLDDQGGDRRGRAGPCSWHRAQQSLQLAGPRRIPEQAALRDALLIRGPCRASVKEARHRHEGPADTGIGNRGVPPTPREARPTLYAVPSGLSSSVQLTHEDIVSMRRLRVAISTRRIESCRPIELNRAGRSSTPGGQGAGHYQRDRPA